MPSKSAAQAKLMNIAAHTRGGYGGVPQSVGRDFHAADKAKGKPMAKEYESAAEMRREKANPKLEARETPAQRKRESTPPKKKGKVPPQFAKKAPAGGRQGLPGMAPNNFMNRK
jgi:hypothetical protein